MDGIIPKHIRAAYPESVPQQQVRGKLIELLGLESIPNEVDFSAEPAGNTDDGLRVMGLAYGNSLGETVTAVLTAPAEAGPQSLAGVVCLPGTSGSAERIADPTFHRPEPCTGPLVGWARELARRGFATLSISVKGCRARLDSNKRWAEEAKLLAPYGRSQMGILVEEALRGARVLAADQAVDPDRVGMTGFSLGGNATWYATACDPWIRAAVPVCGGVGSMASVIHTGNPQRHSSYFFIPHMLRYFDHPEIVAACIAPRPFMIIAPTNDEDMPRSGVDELIRVVAAVYESAGCGDRFRAYQPEGSHLYLIEYFERMVAWFERFLTKDDVRDAL